MSVERTSTSLPTSMKRLSHAGLTCVEKTIDSWMRLAKSESIARVTKLKVVARKASLAIEESVARAECICIVGRICLVAVKTLETLLNQQGGVAGAVRESEIWSEPAHS
jgi:hypothetical protein